VTGVRDSEIRPRLEQALREALRARDTVAVSAVRSALAALDNAQAVPAVPATGASDSPHFAGAAAGLGAGEAERRRLGEAEARDIVRAEVAEREAPTGSCQPRSSAVAVPKGQLLPTFRYIYEARGVSRGLRPARAGMARARPRVPGWRGGRPRPWRPVWPR
jgi:uncharacterized protein